MITDGIIYQGETKMIEIFSEDSEFPIADIKNIVLTITYENTETELFYDDFTLVTDPDTREALLQYLIDQEVTLAWKPKSVVQIELDVLSEDGNRVHIDTQAYKIKPVKYDRVLT